MSTLIKGTSLRQIDLGILVARTTAALPATATGNIFTIAGGLVLVTSLIGKVTTVMGATATTVTMQYVPTAGTAGTTVLGTATAVTSAEVGSLIYPNVGGAVVVKNAGAPYPVGPGISATTGSTNFLLNPGAINLTTSATDTGSVAWYLTYVPYDDGASVAAA